MTIPCNSVEQKLYEAYRLMTGVKLTAKDVEDLLLLDDAIRTRISNTLCLEAGIPEIGCDIIRSDPPTWNKLVKELKRAPK